MGWMLDACNRSIHIMMMVKKATAGSLGLTLTTAECMMGL